MLVNIETDPLRAMQLAPQQYDLILLDAMLGMMDGLQLLHFIKNQAPAGKFVIISDTSDESSRASAYQNGGRLLPGTSAQPGGPRPGAGGDQGHVPAAHGGNAVAGGPDNPPVGIVDVVQMHCLSGDSILLLVRSRQQSGDIFIYRGEVYHAQFPGRGGEAAFREMIHWDDGRVRVKTVKLTHSPPRTIEVPYRQLLGAADQLEPARPRCPAAQRRSPGGRA
ncbi:MAG: response regulator [Verrucomicrobiota bacterium]